MNIHGNYSAYSLDFPAPAKTGQHTAPQSAATNNAQSTGSFSDILAAAKKSPAKELEDYLAMSDAERYQMAWLKSNGLTKEQFDALPAEEKQKLTDKMQQEMKQEMQARLDAAKEQNKLAISLLG